MPTNAEIPRIDVLGVGISAINMAMALDIISGWVRNQVSRYVCVTGVHGVMESVRDPHLRYIHNDSGLTTPDGMPMVWCAHWAGADHVERVSGPDLMLAIASVAARNNWSSYFYGGKKGVPELLSRRLEGQLPGFKTAGTHSPPFRELTTEEDEHVVETINQARPNLVWVGLSTPKQERWMASHVDRIDGAVMLGVGAAFDINAGLVRRAPAWMRRSGLEWAYRLGTEPRRLWRRYLRNNPSFACRILMRPPALVEPDAIADSL